MCEQVQVLSCSLISLASLEVSRQGGKLELLGRIGAYVSFHLQEEPHLPHIIDLLQWQFLRDILGFAQLIGTT